MPDIGATLREARMRAKIDINEVERRTKIRAKYLRAMENEEWDLLPGEVYVKSFLRTYGDFLGLDSRQLMDDYKRRYERPSDHELRPITPRSRDRERRRRRPVIPPWAVIGLVLVAVVAALYFVGRKPGGSTSTTTGTHANTGPRRHSGQAAAGTHTTKPKAVRTKVKLQLVATGQVYVCLVDGAGKPLIPGLIFSPGQTIPTKTSSKLLLTLGNASVKMTVNGQPVSVTPSSSAIGYLLTPTSHSPLPPSRQPRCA
ncbi:MAG TPA: helix-turn-helix domain-containing protein [Solirubrobacteraceae bacterium]|jgi:cytoskeleton protein RodZ|nr:helix-turn-helix domain-containing protein [Solirubrobacteraceae bacterium]